MLRINHQVANRAAAVVADRGAVVGRRERLAVQASVAEGACWTMNSASSIVNPFPTMS